MYMNKILELREKRAKLWDSTKAFLDSKRNENGLLSAENTATSSAIRNNPSAILGNEKTGRASNEYNNAFWKTMRNKNSFDVHNALQIGSDSEGGFLAPDEFEKMLIESLEEQNIFRQIANIITTSSGDKKIPVVAGKGTASWVDEEGVIPESDDSFGQVSIGAYKLATMIKVSEELLNDSVFNLESYIAKEFARELGPERKRRSL